MSVEAVLIPIKIFKGIKTGKGFPGLSEVFLVAKYK